MKIAIFVHGYLPWDVYGIPRHVERLSKYLSDNGHKVWIITRGNSYLKKTEKINDNLIIFRTFHLNLKNIRRLMPFIQLWNIFWYSIMTLIEGTKLIKQNKIEILHGHHFEYGGLQAILVGKLLKKRTIMTIHGPGTLQNLYNSKNYQATIIKYLLKSCTNIIVNNTISYLIVKNLNYNVSKLFLISNGIDSHKFKRNNELRLESRKKINVGENEIVILFLGRLDYFRGAHIFIEAIERIKDLNNIKIIICGDGPLSEIIRKKAFEMSSKVIYVGRTDNPFFFHNLSDIFVNPTPIYGVSLSTLESMSIGNICLITETLDSQKSFTGKEVFFIRKPVTAEEIAKILKEIITNFQNYRIMGEKLSQKIETGFDQKEIFKKITNLYKKSLKSIN